MQKYQSTITATNGSVIRNVPVTVIKEDGSLAEIFMDREGQVQAPNPLVTDSRGVFYFYAKNGRYSLRTAADGVQITDADTVLLFDPDETVSDGPIADAVRRAEDAAERAETALGDSGLQNMVQDAQDAAANAAQAVIDAHQAVASIDAALIEVSEAKEDAQAAAQTASTAASDAKAIKDSLLNYDGTLSANPEWSAVPAHEDSNLDAQTQAALNRIEKLKDDQQLKVGEVIEAEPSWDDVPKHKSEVFNAQAQALANRSEVLQKRTEGLLNVRAFIETPIDGVTSNQAGIEAAVAAAYAAGAELEWPAGTYVSTANIPNFWDVAHKGKGVIKRETHTFMIKGGRTSFKNVFLSPSGSDSNDGLTPDVPIKSIQKVFDALADMGAVRGRWVCNLASGVYTKGGILSGKKQLDYRITVKGPEVPLNNTPLAVFDGATRETENGLFFDGCADLELRDIKFINFDSRPSVSAGWVAANTGVLRLINVHADECGVGYYPRNHTIYFVTGGKVTRCDIGILELFGVVRNFKNVTNIGDGFKVTNCTYGLFAKEHCTGHLDFSTITDNVYGIFFSRSCTANASDSVIKRNQYGAVLRNGSYMVPLRIDWGHNTVDANTVAPWLADASSGFTVNENDVKTTNSSGVVGFKNMGERQIGALIPSSPISITGTTAYTTPIFATVQQGSMSTAGLKFRVSVFGVRTTATSAANIELRIGGVGGPTVQLPASPGAFRVDFDVMATGSGSQYVSASASVNGANSVAVGRGARAIPFASSDYPLAVRLTHTDSGDSALIDCAFAYSNESMKIDA